MGLTAKPNDNGFDSIFTIIVTGRSRSPIFALIMTDTPSPFDCALLSAVILTVAYAAPFSGTFTTSSTYVIVAPGIDADNNCTSPENFVSDTELTVRVTSTCPPGNTETVEGEAVISKSEIYNVIVLCA